MSQVYPLSLSFRRWLICGVLFLATMLNYMDRLALPQTATELKDRYAIDDARYGIVERNFSWAFALGSILFGIIADRYGPRRIYPIVILGWSAAGLATPLLGDPNVTRFVARPEEPTDGPFLWLLGCRTILGLFEAGHWPCALITARQILTNADRPLGNGILQSGASVGAVLVPLYVMGVRHLGGDWRIVFWSVGAVGLLWVPLWMGLVRRGDLGSSLTWKEKEYPDDVVPWRSILRTAITLFAVVTSISISWQFLRAWLPKYLKESQGFSPDEADWVVSGYYIAADLGCLASGLLVRLLVKGGRSIDSARIVGFALFSMVTLLAALVPLVGSGWGSVALLMLSGAGILGLHPFYYALVQELPAKHMGLLSGLLTAGGWIVIGQAQQLMGARIEATRSYDVGFVLAGIAPLVGLFSLLALWRPLTLKGGE